MVENKVRQTRRSSGKRLFFALWPDEQSYQALKALTDTLPYMNVGRRVPAQNWHVTLAFLGEVNDTAMPRIMDVAAAIKAPPFTVHFDHLVFNKHGDLWLACREMPASLNGLVTALKRDLSGQGFKIEQRRYRPHITLMRNLKEMPEQPALKPILLYCHAFTLVMSTLHPQGSRYDVLSEWPLG